MIDLASAGLLYLRNQKRQCEETKDGDNIYHTILINVILFFIYNAFYL